MSTLTPVIIIKLYVSLSAFVRSTIKKPLNMHFSYFLEYIQPSAADHRFPVWMQDFELNLFNVSGCDQGTIHVG